MIDKTPTNKTRATYAPGDQDPAFGTVGTLPGTDVILVVTEIMESSENKADQKFYLLDKELWKASSISRYEAKGRPDQSFNGGAPLEIPSLVDDLLTGHIYVHGMIFHPESGTITCVGDTVVRAESGHYHAPGAIRLTASGEMDVTFGKEGTAIYPTGQVSATSNNTYLAPFASPRRSQQPADQDVIFVARLLDFNTRQHSFYLVKIKPDGAADDQFGDDGNGLLLLDTDGDGDAWYDYGVDSLGNILLVGVTTSGSPTYGKMMRYTADGQPDPSFGSGGGVQIVDAGGEQSRILQMYLSDEGKSTLLLAVYEQGQDTEKMALIRRLANGEPDTTFNNGDALFIDVFYNNGSGSPHMEVDGEGRFIIRQHIPNTPARLTRLTPEGLLDGTFGSNGTIVYSDLLALHRTAVHRDVDLLARIHRDYDTKALIVRYLG
jgi:uncharacterized delta-60 repeat protein